MSRTFKAKVKAYSFKNLIEEIQNEADYFSDKRLQLIPLQRVIFLTETKIHKKNIPPLPHHVKVFYYRDYFSLYNLPKKPNPFRKLLNLEWKEIKVLFIDDETVKIKAREINQEFKFSHMGFEDHRRPNYPNRQWDVLLIYARSNGIISWETKIKNIENKDRYKIKTQTKELRKKLKIFFGINDDPILPYSKQKKEYQTKFVISVASEEE